MKKWKILSILLLVALLLSSIIHAGAAEWITRQLEAVYRDIKIVVDDREITPTDVNGKVVTPFIVDGTTYVPLRAIGEALGKDVSWESETSTVRISTPADNPSQDYPDVPPAPSKNAEVSTAAELVKAIAPDTCITLKAGKYDLSTVAGAENPYVFWQEDYAYGTKEKTLIIKGVDALTLQAAPGADVEIVTPWRFADVLSFSQCNGIKVDGIKAGHSVTGDYECDAGVLVFRNSYNTSVNNSYLYGCGSIGLEMETCVGAQIQNTTITDCSLRAVDLTRSENIAFTKCKFIDNRAYGCVIFGIASSAEFVECEITGNKKLEWDLVEFDSDALFERCVFRDNALVEGNKVIFSGPRIRLRGCEIEKNNFNEYWGSGVVDLGDNKLK